MYKRQYTHYERAFEGYLQTLELPYVAVDQAKKALLSGSRVKSFDFILYPRRDEKLLVDVKGRKLSWDAYQQGRCGQTWITEADLEGLDCWERIFGDGYRSMFAFVWWLHDVDMFAGDGDDVFTFEGRYYIFNLVDLPAYRRHARPRSLRWRTLFVSAKIFPSLATPLKDMLS